MDRERQHETLKKRIKNEAAIHESPVGIQSLLYLNRCKAEKGQREKQNSTVPLPFREKAIRGKGQHVSPVMNYAQPGEDE